MRFYLSSLLAIILTALLFAHTGCTRKPGDRLIGKWEGAGRFDSIGPGVEAQFAGEAAARIHLTAEFRADGSTTSSRTICDLADEKPWEGTWQVIESGQDRLVVELTADNDGKTASKRAEIEFLSDDQISLVDPEEMMVTEFILNRVH